MPPPKHPTRKEQPATTGLGLVFSSPCKRRDKKKSASVVSPLGRGVKRRRLQQELRELQARACAALGDASTVEPEADTLSLCHNNDKAGCDSNLGVEENDPPQAGLLDIDVDGAQPRP